MSLRSRLTNVFRPARVRRELDDEVQFHVEERIRELMATGLSREAAAEQAARRLGSRLRTREQSLDVKLMPWLESLVRDIRLGLRVHLRNAPVTIAAVLSLALALGASVAAFSLIDALILRPLSVREPGRLVYLAFNNVSRSGSLSTSESSTFADPMFVQLREAGRDRVALFAMSTQVLRSMSFDGADAEKEQVRTQFVSGDAFTTLGVSPAAGRLLSTEDDLTPGAHPVAILSHAFWQRRFGGDPSVVGRWLSHQEAPFQTRQFQIVGVTESDFGGVEPGRPTDVWLPYAMYNNPKAFGNFQFNFFRIFGRLRDGVPVEQAAERTATGVHRLPAEIQRLGAWGFAGGARSGTSKCPLTCARPRTALRPCASQFERPLWILGGNRAAGAADRRIQRREPVSRAHAGARARDVAAPFDWRRARAPDPAGSHRNRACRGCRECPGPAVCRSRGAGDRRHADLARRPRLARPRRELASRCQWSRA